MTELPAVLVAHPSLDQWVRVDPAGTITLFTGKVELGQGLLTALARIGAEELDVTLEQIRVEPADTAQSPNELFTAGSMSLSTSGVALRLAAAHARYRLLELASERLGAPASDLTVDCGNVRSPSGESTTYWELLAGKRFDCRVTGETTPKPPEDHRLVGRFGDRIDIVGLVTGAEPFVQDLALPELLHARVVRPPGPRATLLELDEVAAASLPGVVSVVRDGSFVAVAAEREEQAIRALELLRARARWEPGEPLPPARELHAWLVAQPTQSREVVDGTPVEGPVGEPIAPGRDEQALEARYTRPYLLHGACGPSAALALWDEGRLTVWAGSQGIFPLRAALAEALELELDLVRVIYAPASGCYGHNGVDDVALDAALVALTVPGRPVLLKWTRDDEHAWEPCGPAMVVQVTGILDAGRRRVSGWNLETWSNTHMARPEPGAGAASLLASRQRAASLPPPRPQLRMQSHVGIHRNADPLYTFPRRHIVKHLVERSAVRTSSLRALGAYLNILAIESTMDDLALAAGADPVDFRLAHLDDPRAHAVIAAAAERAGWSDRADEFGRGKGIGFSRYKNAAAFAAVVADVTVDDETAAIHVDRVVVAADAGEVVDPDGLVSQLEGGVVQSTSWTLLEQVGFDDGAVSSLDWDSYPVLRFPDVPAIDVVLLDRPGQPFLGAGEATQGPTAAAIANAVFAAIGVRLRDTPFTPERVRAAVESQDVFV